MLSIGAAMLGAVHVVGVDIDEEALAVAQENVEEFEDPLPVSPSRGEVGWGMGCAPHNPHSCALRACTLQIDFLRCSVQQLAAQQRLRADTVVMNPPFGTRRKGADIDFLRAAFKLSTHSVYSLHKSSTREYVGKLARRELGAASAEVLAELRYDLPASYSFHRERSRDIEVDLWRFEVAAGGTRSVGL